VYAVQLAKLSSLTGESVEALMKKKAADEEEAAFGNFLRDLGEKAGPATLEAFRQMPKELQKVAFEQATFGQAVTGPTAKLLALDPVAGRLGVNFGNLARAGNLNIDTMIEQAKTSEKALIDEQNRTRELNKVGYLARDSVGETVNSAYAITKWATMLGTNADGVSKGIDAQKDAALKSGDIANNLTGEFIKMEIAGRELRNKIQNLVIPALGEFSGHLNEAFQYIEDLMNKKIGGATAAMDQLTKGLDEIKQQIKDYHLDLSSNFFRLLDEGYQKIFNKQMEMLEAERAARLGGENGRVNPPPRENTPRTPGATVAEERTVSGLNEQQRTKFQELRSQGVAPADALRQVRTPGQNLTAAENRVVRNSTATPTAAPTAAPTAVPETGGMFSGITNWFDGVKSTVGGKVTAAMEAITPATQRISGAIDGFFGGIAKTLTELPMVGKGISFLGTQIGKIASGLGKMAGPITIFLSGLEAWRDYTGWSKGDISTGEFSKRLTGNVVSTVAAWLASGAVTAAVGTSGLFTAGTTTVLAPAAGVATFMGTQYGTKLLSDKIFDMFGVGDAAGTRPAVPVNPNSSTTPGVPVSSVDPRIPVIENAKAQSLAAAEQSKTTAELVKQQLVQQASQKSSTEMLASIDKNIKDMADATRLGNEQRGKGVRYSQHIAMSQS
jgi:hypothetical protein